MIKFVTNKIPLYLRTNPYLPRAIGDKIFLRFAALKLADWLENWRFGLLKAAAFPKRALQFGSRIANIEKSKLKTDGSKIRASNQSKNLFPANF